MQVVVATRDQLSPIIVQKFDSYCKVCACRGAADGIASLYIPQHLPQSSKRQSQYELTIKAGKGRGRASSLPKHCHLALQAMPRTAHRMRKPKLELSPAYQRVARATCPRESITQSVMDLGFYLMEAHTVHQCHGGEVPNDDVSLQAHEIQLARCQVPSRRRQDQARYLKTSNTCQGWA